MTAGSVLLLRHGTTDWNDDGRFQGHADVPLNDRGVALAERAADALAARRPARVISSDLSRALQTARPIAAATGRQVEVDPRLREVDVGSWAGLDMATVGERELDFWPALQQGRDFRRSPQGETATESGERVAAALREHAAEAAADEVLLVVGHGLSLRVGALLLMGLDYSYARLFGGMANCGWIELRPPDGAFGWAGDPGERWRMIAYNRVAAG